MPASYATAAVQLVRLVRLLDYGLALESRSHPQ